MRGRDRVKPATAAISNPDNLLFLSDASVWEIALKFAAGKLPLPKAPRIWIPQQVAFFQLGRVAIEREALLRASELPPIHQDPLDRLLAAQALEEPFHVVSPDKPFRAYGVSCVW